MLACQDLQLMAGARCLVRELSLQVQAGSRWAVLGPNGAGKSTLLAALAGVHAADGGVILLNGLPLAAHPVHALAQQRALVTDRWHDPFVASVRETVQTGRYRWGTRDPDAAAAVQAALETMDVAHLAQADVRWLSRGERQRVALATALVQDTPLVLLDEPIAHQDPRHQLLVLQRLAARVSQTLVATLHDVNAALRFATHALLLPGDGSWHAGPAAEVLTAERLSAVFGLTLRAVTVDGQRALLPAHDG